MSKSGNIFAMILAGASLVFLPAAGVSQTAPSGSMIAAYKGLHKAAHAGDVDMAKKLIAEGKNPESRDRAGRTPLHVAAFASHEDVVKLLVASGADVNALENQAYDIVTIAAVANDMDMLNTALELGANPGNITSPYDGNALIAAAHLGHKDVVKRLIDGGSPLDHINNLQWTAMIEVVVLGDGGPNHVESLRHLLEAGADRNIADRNGVTPLEHARSRGFAEMVELLEE